jgi:hypothetical protein
LLISALIQEPLKFFFSNYTEGSAMVWNEDEKLRTVEIGDFHDFHKITFQERPRILVNRGSYLVQKSGLSDNLAEAKSMFESKGLIDRINFVLYSGTASIAIEARNKGTCELLADMVSHFILWSRPYICDTQGFKEFGLNMQVSPCEPTNDQDDTTFQIQITLPYMKEEAWKVFNDGIAIKGFIGRIRPVPVILPVPLTPGGEGIDGKPLIPPPEPIVDCDADHDAGKCCATELILKPEAGS